MESQVAYLLIFFFKIQGLKAGLAPTMFLTLPLPEAWGYRAFTAIPGAYGTGEQTQALCTPDNH